MRLISSPPKRDEARSQLSHSVTRRLSRQERPHFLKEQEGMNVASGLKIFLFLLNHNHSTLVYE